MLNHHRFIDKSINNQMANDIKSSRVMQIVRIEH